MKAQGGDTKTLSDGTTLMFCEPHRRWEWDCYCGQANPTSETHCTDCGRERS